jgi:hypothetical protein
MFVFNNFCFSCKVNFQNLFTLPRAPVPWNQIWKRARNYSLCIVLTDSLVLFEMNLARSRWIYKKNFWGWLICNTGHYSRRPFGMTVLISLFERRIEKTRFKLEWWKTLVCETGPQIRPSLHEATWFSIPETAKWSWSFAAYVKRTVFCKNGPNDTQFVLR